MQYMEPMKTEGRTQKSIKQELKLKTCSFQTRTYKDKKNHPLISDFPIYFPSPLNTNIN